MRELHRLHQHVCSFCCHQILDMFLGHVAVWMCLYGCDMLLLGIHSSSAWQPLTAV